MRFDLSTPASFVGTGMTLVTFRACSGASAAFADVDTASDSAHKKGTKIPPLSVVVACLLFLATVVGGDQLVAKPLPGNKACAFPPQAQKEFVAGPVQFVALIRPDGTVESVDVSRVPLPRLGFEDAVRACVSEWRFDAASPGGGLRRYEGHVRFRLDTSEEAAIRGLLEALEAAWNSGDMKAVEDLAPAIR